jgi:vacuolar-type H+-ATPase subunit E/Vma4
MEETIKAVYNRKPNGKFGPGNNANPKGRPEGKTLKEFAREMLMSMNDEEKKAYMAELPKDIVWRMAEGNPHTTTDVTSDGKCVVGFNLIVPDDRDNTGAKTDA